MLPWVFPVEHNRDGNLFLRRFVNDVAQSALDVLGGTLHPGRFNNPPLYKYALAAIDGVWYAAGRAGGADGTPDDFRARAAAGSATICSSGCWVCTR